MVFSGLVTSLINRFLSPYVDELSESQLNFFAWTGQVTLTNVALKTSALDAFRLPIRVVHGAVGQIEATVPWMNLYSEPIILRLSDVYLVALPNWGLGTGEKGGNAPYTKEEEEQIAWETKKAALESIEAIKQKIIDEQTGKKENNGFLMKLLIAAIKNVQIKVNRVHVLFEDNSAISDHSKQKKVLQIGCFFSKLIFETEDVFETIQSNYHFINKMIRLEGFTVYMNTNGCGQSSRLHSFSAAKINRVLKERITSDKEGVLEYILGPMNLNTNAGVHGKPEEDFYQIPIVDLSMNLDHFRLQLSNDQIEAALLLLKAIERMQLAAPCLKWRPQVPIQIDPKKWWTFLVTATLEVELRPRKRQFRWTAIERACKAHKAYTGLYTKKLLGDLPHPLKISLSEMERLERQELTLIAIVHGRSQAEKEAAVEARHRQQQQNPGQNFQNSNHIPTDRSNWFNRFWSFWGASPEEDRSRNIDPMLLNLKDQFMKNGEEREKLYQAIGYDQDKDRWIFYPPKYTAFRATFCIEKMTIVIKDGKGGDTVENSAAKSVSLLNMNLDTCRFNFSSRPSSGNFFFKMALSRMTVVGLNNVILLNGSSEKLNLNLLDCTVEVAPLDRHSDLCVNLKLGSLYLLYDIETINRLYDSVIRRLKKAKADDHYLTLEDNYLHLHHHVSGHRALKEVELASMKGASAVSKPPQPLDVVVEHHKQIEASVQVEPLSVIVPNTGSLETATGVLIMSIGKIIVTSKLPPKSAVKEAAKEMMAKTPAASIAPVSVPNRTDSLEQKTPNPEDVEEGGVETKSVTRGGGQQQPQLMELQQPQPLDEPQQQEKQVMAKYACQLNSIQVVMSDAGHWKEDLRFVGLDTERHIIHPFNIDISVDLSLVPSGMQQLIIVTFSHINIDLAPQLVGTALDIVATMKVFTELPPPKAEDQADIEHKEQEEFINAHISEDFLQPKPIVRQRAWFLYVVRPPHWDEPEEGEKGGEGECHQEAEPIDQIFLRVLSKHQVILICLKNIKVQIRQCQHSSTAALVLAITSIQASMVDGKRLTFSGQFGGEYFNKGMRAWEPLIETVHSRPFAFEGAVSLAEKGIVKVRMETVESLELLISKTLVGVLLNLVEAFQAAMAKDGKKKENKRDLEEDCILIRNHLGISIVLDVVKSGLEGVVSKSSHSSKKKGRKHHHEQQKKSYRTEVIKSDGEIQFRAKNVAFVELVVKLQFSEVHVISRKIACSVSATRCYFTELKSARNESFKWIVQVTDHGTSKEVDFRSHIQLVNTFDRPFSLYSYNGKKASTLGTIDADSTISLPLPLVFGENFLYVRPSSEYYLSDVPVDWHSLDMGDNSSSSTSPSDQPKVKQIFLGCSLKTDPQNTSFTIKARGLRTGTALYEDTDHHSSPSGVEDACAMYSVSLLPLVRFRNQLPYNVQYYYGPMKAGQLASMAPGDETNLPYAVFGKTSISLKLVNYLGRNWKASVHLPESGGLSEDHYYRFMVTSSEHLMSPVVEEESPKRTPKEGESQKEEENSSKESICLAVNFAVEKHTLVLSLFSPFWCVNQTPLHVGYKVQTSNDEDDGIFSHPDSLGEAPFLLAFDPAKMANKDQLALSVAGSDYSAPFPVNIVPYNGSVLPPAVNVPVEKSASPGPKPVTAQTSSPKSIGSQGSTQETTPVPAEAEKKEETVVKKFLMRIHVQLAAIGRSKIITVRSFYNIYNVSQNVVQYSEEEGGQWASIGSKAASSCFFPQKTANQTMVFRFEGREEFVSKSVSLRSSSQTLLPIGGAYLFVEVAVSEEEVKIKLSDYFYGAAPVLIINDLPVPVHYGQKDVTEWVAVKTAGEGEENNEREGGGSDTPGPSLLGKEVSVLPPKQMSFFCWLDPMATRQLIYRIPRMPILNEDQQQEQQGTPTPKSKDDVISFDFDKYQTMDDQGLTGWVTFFDGKQRVLIFTDNPELPELLLNTEELIKPKFSLELIVKGVGLNIVNEELKKDLLYLSIRSNVVWEGCEQGKTVFKSLSLKESALLEEMYQMHLSSRRLTITHKSHRVNFLEMRMTEPHQLTLQRLTNRAIWLHISAAEHITQLHLKVAGLQVDNQLHDHVYAVIICPVALPKEVVERNDQLTAKSFVEVSAIVQSLAGSKVTRIKYAQVLVQEFLVQADLGWAVQFIDLLPEGFELSSKKTDKDRIKEDLDEVQKNNTLIEMQRFGMDKTYYDYLLLGPMKLHLSVTMGDLPEGKMPAFIDTIIRFTGLTLAEINGTLFKLDYFERTNLACSNEELAKVIAHHYTLQISAQLYKLILGLDIIGNPGKLASDITKGIGDFFYEPVMGIVIGPEEFAEGFAMGVHSLTTNIVGGTAAALGRIGHRLGTGVAALSGDKKFQKERRERTNKEATFSASGKHLVRGFVDGFGGLVSKPVEGAQRSGFGGLLRGVGQGLVGVIVQPTTGVLDAAATGLHALNNSIDTKTVAQPARPPRHFPSGRQLAPYNLYAAIGNQHLRALADGKYTAEGEEYEYHLQLDSQRIVLLSTTKIFYLEKSLFAGAWEIDWAEDWINVQAVTNDGDRLQLTVRGQPSSGFCFFGGSVRRTIVDRNEEHIKELYKHVTRHIDGASAPPSAGAAAQSAPAATPQQ